MVTEMIFTFEENLTLITTKHFVMDIGHVMNQMRDAANEKDMDRFLSLVLLTNEDENFHLLHKGMIYSYCLRYSVDGTRVLLENGYYVYVLAIDHPYWYCVNNTNGYTNTLMTCMVLLRHGMNPFDKKRGETMRTHGRGKRLPCQSFLKSMEYKYLMLVLASPRVLPRMSKENCHIDRLPDDLLEEVYHCLM